MLATIHAVNNLVSDKWLRLVEHRPTTPHNNVYILKGLSPNGNISNHNNDPTHLQGEVNSFDSDVYILSFLIEGLSPDGDI